MFKYNFAIAVNENPVTKQQRREKAFSVETPYDMLSYLSYSCQDIQFVNEIIQNLKEVRSKKQAQYGYWGHDMAYVMSYAEKSVVTYTHVNDQNAIVDSDIEVPTSAIKTD